MQDYDYSQLELSYVIPIYIENEENSDLEKLLEVYSSYDPQLLKQIQFIFVDDCSPTSIEIENSKINYTLVRIKDDIQWNQGGARNLGVHLAKTSKLILTDMDHLFPEKVLAFLCDMPVKKAFNQIYKFRRKKNGKKINSHPNTFFMTKATYYKSLGVDEEFCGNYGWEDIYFLELQKFLGTRIRKYRNQAITVKDHKQHFLKRDTEINTKLLEKKRKALKNGTPFKEHSRKSLAFDWKTLETHWI